jgi:outer membrane protein OmpA-like peptidoglycan-associated protein
LTSGAEIKSCRGLSGTLLTLYFDQQSQQLNTQAQNQLQQWLASLKNKNNLSLVLEGHTDRQGTALNNLRFSNERAQSVANELLDKGFSASNLIVDGNGEFGLVSDEAELNRRVEIWVQQDRSCENVETLMPNKEMIVEGDNLH